MFKHNNDSHKSNLKWISNLMDEAKTCHITKIDSIRLGDL